MAWVAKGSIKGPKGDKGDEGPEGPQGPKGPRGPEGPEGPEGPQGIPGEPGADGQDGAGIDLQNSVDTYDDLPDTLGPGDAGQAFLNRADGRLYIWDGSSFQPEGEGVEFRGPKGDKGDQGERGPKGADGAEGPPGQKGDKGDTGDQGEKGDRGSLWYTGDGVPSGIAGAQDGDMYLDVQTGAVYTFEG